jgi:hypothetical protein
LKTKVANLKASFYVPCRMKQEVSYRSSKSDRYHGSIRQ